MLFRWLVPGVNYVGGQVHQSLERAAIAGGGVEGLERLALPGAQA